MTSRGSSLISASAVYVCANVFNAAIPFALLPVLTRYLSPSEYGEIAMFQTLLGALGAIVGFGTSGVASRKFFDKEAGKNELAGVIGACLQILLVSTFIVFTLVFLFRDSISGWLNLRPTWVVWAVIMAALSFPVQIRLGQWEVRRNARAYGGFQIAQTLLNAGLSLFLVVAVLHGAPGRVHAQIATACVMAAAALAFLARDEVLKVWQWNPGHMRESIAYGVPLIPHLASAFILATFDRVLISNYLGLGEAGIYMVSVQIAGALLLVFDAICRAFSPWLFERLAETGNDRHKLVVSRVYALCAVMLVGGLSMVVVGPWITKFVAGERYARAGEVIGWMAMAQAFYGIYLVLSLFILYAKQTKFLSLITFGCGAVQVALVLFFVDMMGLKGAAIALCLGMAARCGLTWWVAQICQPMPWFGGKPKLKYAN